MKLGGPKVSKADTRQRFSLHSTEQIQWKREGEGWEGPCVFFCHVFSSHIIGLVNEKKVPGTLDFLFHDKPGFLMFPVGLSVKYPTDQKW